MHTDLIEKIIARRLDALADEPAEAPYDWAEFDRRRQAAPSVRGIGRIRLAAMAAAISAVAVVAGILVVHSAHPRTPPIVQADTAGTTPDPLTQAHTRAVEGWLAALPRDPGVVRVGTHVAVSSLQDQIAELDDLMSAARVAGAGPGRLDTLERRRAQLVSSLAQLRYAELLASATP